MTAVVYSLTMIIELQVIKAIVNNKRLESLFLADSDYKITEIVESPVLPSVRSNCNYEE